MGIRKKLLVLATAIVLVIGVGVGVGVYCVGQSVSYPSEETAKFLPVETPYYVSVNLRPGVSQLMEAREILNRFKENRAFNDRLEELYEDIEESTGIDVEEDLYPWLGPEIAIAIPAIEGIDETPEFVAFIGASDVNAAESFLRNLAAFAEETSGTEYRETLTRGYLTFVVDSVRIALTDKHIVIASKAKTLLSTLERMDAGYHKGQSSLFNKPEFQAARDAADSPRFGTMYVDISEIVAQLEEGSNAEDVEDLKAVTDQLPDFLVASMSFIEKGIRVSASFDLPGQWFSSESANTLGSAARTPEDTVALLSFAGVQEAWERLRAEAADQGQFDLDKTLDEVEFNIGIDIERDILGWITGELALAILLPGGVPFSTDELHANVYVEFDNRDEAVSSMARIQAAMEDEGAEFADVDIENMDAVVMDLGDDQGPPYITPGYVVLDKYVVIGTTSESLRQAILAQQGAVPSLRENAAFEGSMAELGSATDYIMYGNIQRVVEEVIGQLDETELYEYRETTEPFVEPLEAFLLGIAAEDDIFTLSAVLTFD